MDLASLYISNSDSFLQFLLKDPMGPDLNTSAIVSMEMKYQKMKFLSQDRTSEFES